MVNNLINDYRRKKHIQNVSYLSRLKNIIVEGFDEEFFVHNVQLFQPRTTRQSVGVGIGRKGIGVGTSKSFHSSTDQTIVDSGRLSINVKGLRFIGTTKQLAWDWKKIVEIQIHQNNLVIPVSNRQNISGVVLPFKPDVVKIIGTWLVDFANGDEISDQQLPEPQEIDIMSKKNLGIAVVTIFCLLTIAVINPSTLLHDMDGSLELKQIVHLSQLIYHTPVNISFITTIILTLKVVFGHLISHLTLQKLMMTIITSILN